MKAVVVGLEANFACGTLHEVSHCTYVAQGAIDITDDRVSKRGELSAVHTQTVSEVTRC